ncbi:2'-5' RNA ligase family protein [Nocardioides cynanchi]|uniref:2'-5' RNA ligase family protein n=1 Tax=Nocardioides cynanchi TaxID=2558918 RepID=UPI001248E840|nr:2'-5' RNA ligase family protein [Nocardioides cynanchi]
MPTIGVSLAVPEPWGSRLQDFRVANGDEQGAAIPTHITLVPPIEVDSQTLGPIEQHLGEVARLRASYDVHLRGSGTFRPVSPVVFINLVQGISQTEQLAHACRSGPLALTLDFPYHPHVTVAHHLDDDRLDRAFDEMADFECAFPVSDFHLYVHDGDSGWTATHDFVLTGPPG